MFTFYIQLLDLIYTKEVGIFLVFFVISWSIWLVKFIKSFTYKKYEGNFDYSVSIIIPVVDEEIGLFKQVLDKIKVACRRLPKYEIIVVPNGSNSVKEEQLAREMGLIVKRSPEANKRKAIQVGAELTTGEITILLDSDTLVNPDSIEELLKPFNDPTVGGVVPRQHIINPNTNFIRRMCEWLEDMRFMNVKGQSASGSVAVLTGSFYAMRTTILRRSMPYFVNQTFLGNECIIGDDRVLTSCILKEGYKTVYQESSVVWTNCPDDIKKLMRQRTRWARSSLRETIISIPWLYKYPYMSFVLIGDIITRWMFFVVFIHAILLWTGKIEANSVFFEMYPQLANIWIIVSLSIMGMLTSGLVRGVYHLLLAPKDVFFLPVFLVVNMIFITPTQWFGNLTCWENGWMTRNLNKG